MALEGELFAELEREVDTQTAGDDALSRFNRGSLVHPERFETDWNRSFEWPVESPRGGVLLLHGLTDSPYSLRTLGEALHARGYWVVGLRYPGHGTVPAGLAQVSWEDMAAAASLAVEHLAQVAGPDAVHLIGYSTGAPLAIEQALAALSDGRGPVPASLVLVSPAIAVTRAAAGARWIGYLAVLPGLEKLAWTQILPEFDPFKYNSFAVRAGYEVHRLTGHVSRALVALDQAGRMDDFPPTLVFLSTVDATVTSQAVIDNLLEHLPEGRSELVLFDINRNQVKESLLVRDPGPLTAALLGNPTLPFHLAVVGNESPSSQRVEVRRKPPLSVEISRERLPHVWPLGAISLSHVALPFPSDDPLYGARPDESEDVLHLGAIAFQGERGLLSFPDSWLLRLRHNPFYDFLEARALAWVENR